MKRNANGRFALPWRFPPRTSFGKRKPVLHREVLYGRVFDTELPGIGPRCADVTVSACIVIRLEKARASESLPDAFISAQRTGDGASVELLVRGVARFRISPTSIDVSPEPGVRDDIVRLFCRYHAFGILLRLSGLVVLHGAAARLPGGAHVWLGPSGAGKTTAALEACLAGGAFLADEVVPLRFDGNVFFVQPGVPWPRLDGGAPADVLGRARDALIAPMEEVPLRRIVLARATGVPGERALFAAQILSGYRPELPPSDDELALRSRLLAMLPSLND